MACRDAAPVASTATPWLDLDTDTASLEGTSSLSSEPSASGETTVSGPSASFSLSWGASLLVAAVVLAFFLLPRWSS